MKLSFYYRAHDSANNDVFDKKIVTSLQPVWNDKTFKQRWILYKGHTYLGMKESGEQRESTSTNSATIFKDYHCT